MNFFYDIFKITGKTVAIAVSVVVILVVAGLAVFAAFYIWRTKRLLKIHTSNYL
jgi:hypothetical protein